VPKRLQHEREAHRSLDAALEMVDHDADVGGGIMAGALAYRMFVWLLPLALVLIAGLGYAAVAAEVPPDEAARSVGIAGMVSNSVAGAAKSSSRVYALLVGIPILLYATRVLLRTLIVTHRLIWSDARGTAPKPTVASTLQLGFALTAFLAISSVAAAVRHTTGPVGGLAALVVILFPYGALWLLVELRLPHGDAPWQSLIPGALVLGIGLEAINLATTLVISPSVDNKQGTYGSLGVAAALLLGLFLISRIVVGSAVVNATLWERRNRSRRT